MNSIRIGQTRSMPSFGAAISTHPIAAGAVGEVIGQVLEAVGEAPDLAVMFVTAPFAGALEDMARVVRTALRPKCLLAATAVAIVGNATEVEGDAAVSLWAGKVGPVLPVRLEAVRTGAGMAIRGWPEAPDTAKALLLLADPFSFPVDAFISSVGSTMPGFPVIGGMASAARGPGGNFLVIDDEVVQNGAVGVMLGSTCSMTTLVSQGCRPIGQPYVVTRATGNTIERLAMAPALGRFEELQRSLSEDDRALLRSGGVHVGVVIDERKAEFARGDFLIRGVMGADRKTGSVTVGGEVAVGTTVQFHVRDAASAHEDLELLLADACASGPVGGALVFTCNGRGRHLFGVPSHDAGLIDEYARAPTAGMFCAGEIGPVGGRPFLHGFTASVALFRPR